ncbi:hypothetical protein [Geminocystis sp. GBBB08]|uniref:hypothetical protein n=1 Tax=Geminocystis sp. GBBB08 TaxID=2604140 RepID=UPI0027E3392A|nr:hypothetical protein [Geminocystis sp. GBBB08]MBL1208229.1 hypothetical protein [Geminocystis sp. GBBB08]
MRSSFMSIETTVIQNDGLLSLNEINEPQIAEISEKIQQILTKRKATAQKPQEILQTLTHISQSIKILQNFHEKLLKDHQTDAKIKDKLVQVDLAKLLTLIAEQEKIWQNLYQRFIRQTINIAGVGLSGQGKSTALKTLTGLSDDEIPSRRGKACTSAQCNIHYTDKDESAIVNCYSKKEFLEEIIHVYFDVLNVTKPNSLEEFAKNDLPPKPSNHPQQATVEAIYIHLDNYHRYFDQYQNSLGKKLKIYREQVKQYVSRQYNDNGDTLINPECLAVKQVDVFCQFPRLRIPQICLVDTIGLGDTRLKDKERLIKALADVDFILIFRFPQTDRNQWEDRDRELFQVAYDALKDKLPLCNWSYVILNHNGNNDVRKNCLDLQRTAHEITSQVNQFLIANCQNADEMNGILTQVLDYLSQNIDRLDEQYMLASYQSLNSFYLEVKTQLQLARMALEDYGNIEAKYPELRNNFLKNLYNEMEALREESRQEQEQNKPDVYFKTQVDSAIEKCKTETGIPSVEELESLKNRHGSYAAAYARAIHQMRPCLLKHFHNVEIGLKESLEDKKIKVANILIELGLGGLTEKKGSEFLKTLADKIPAPSENLRLGFQFISSFEFLYKGIVQSIIWKEISEELPSDPNQMPLLPRRNNNENDTQLLTENDAIIFNLQDFHKKAIKKSQDALEGLAKRLSETGTSMIEEFADHITRSMNIEQEWDIFLATFRSQIWNELKQLEDRNHLKQEWITLIDNIISMTLL